MQDIPFIETTIAKRVFGAIDYVRKLNENAVIVGEPGVGKTRALEAYHAAHEGVAMITLTSFNGSTPRRLMLELSDRLGIFGGGTVYDVHARLLQYNLQDHVLLLDEAQNLSPQSIREIQNLQMSVIFCGNRDVLKSVSVQKGPLAQISDRVGLFEEIDCIPGEDADAIANSFGVEGMDAYQIARAIGTRFRARALVRVLNGAREQAGTKTIKADHIRRAIELYPQYRSALK